MAPGAGLEERHAAPPARLGCERVPRRASVGRMHFLAARRRIRSRFVLLGSRLASRFLLLGTLALAGVIARAPDALAQAKKKPAPKTKSLSVRVAEQKKEIDDLQARLDEQRALVESQTALADSQSVRIHALEAELEELKKRLADLESETGVPNWESELEERLKKIEAEAKKSPELPPDIVSAGDFPGSIRIPGTDAALKIGGRIRTSAVLTLDPLGTDDRFLTNSIPVGGDVVSGEARRTNISARASRFNLEFRTPSGKQELRAFFEGDFAGAGNAFRLRHAYAQFVGWIVGQTWSTFSDPWAVIEDLDFEGISSENVIRQPQLRYVWNSTANTRTAFAIETPSASVTGGAGVNLFPDVISRLYWGYTPEGHLQIAGVLRQIRAEAQAGDVRSDWAYGGTASGVIPNRAWHLKDQIT